MNEGNEVFEPIFFSNSPESDVQKDIFDFENQVQTIDKIIDKGSVKILGIIGDYGAGKSSVTELLEKKRREKKERIIRVNLWDSVVSSSTEKTVDSIVKSFFYQLAYGNSKHNGVFSDYVNYRFNKNQGKISLKIASRGFFIWFSLATIFLLSFLSLNNMDFLLNEEGFKHILYLFRYAFLFITVGMCVIAIRIASPVFTSWKSEGNYEIDNSDILEVYSLIIKRLTKRKKKVIVFIDDLDRLTKYEIVVSFLKELYRCVNLLPKEQSDKLVFVVSLKPEEQLMTNIKDLIYPKIFDYTLNIKPIHCETYYDVVKDLLDQQKDSLSKVFPQYATDVIGSVLKDLHWLYSDEHLTIREIKERLNETFLLYQTLHSRDYKSSSVQLNKAAAVTFLKRKHPGLYYKIIEHEHDFAILIRDCFRLEEFNKVKEMVKRKVDGFFLDPKIESSDFCNDLSEMLSENLIEDDFAIYFYNYPKHSYIKTLDEKELFDSIIHDNEEFLSIDRDGSKIQRIIRDKNAFVIKEAFERFPSKKIPRIVYKNESLFVYVIERLELQKNMIFDELTEDCNILSTTEAKNFERLSLVLNYSFSSFTRDELIKEIKLKLHETLKSLAIQSKDSVIKVRKQLIKAFQSNIVPFSSLFIVDDLPCIDEEEYLLLCKLNIQMLIIKEMSDKRINEFDDLFINSITDDEVSDYLISHNLFKSTLYSYAESKKLSKIDFTNSKSTNQIIDIAEDLFNEDEDFFLQIRTEMLRQIQDNAKDIDYSQLYFEPYPVISIEEFDILELRNLFQVIDCNRADDKFIELLIDFSKSKIHDENDFFIFVNYLLMYDDDNKIIDQNKIKRIVQSVDFEKINIANLDEERLDSIIVVLTPVFELETVGGCIKFMKMVKHLIPKLEQQVIAPELESNSDYLNDYIDLINQLNECTEATFDNLRERNLDCDLNTAITTVLYNKKFYIRYLIGKSLRDKVIPDDPNITIDKYYNAFNMSDNFAELIKTRIDLLNKIIAEGLYEKDLPNERLEVFYKLRQPIKLVNFIMKRLIDNMDELKNYLFSITDFAQKEDAGAFIDFATSDEYVNVFNDSNLFWYCWHKMWNSGQKGKFTRMVNKKLGTNYSSRENE